MGYDLYIINQPERITTLKKDLWATRPDGSPATAEEIAVAYKEIHELEDQSCSYFRLNIWGMRRWREAMVRIGMIEDARGDIPDWPSSDDVDWDDEESESYRAYQIAVGPVLSWTDTTVMARHKFGSNDGWIVTPREIARALDAYKRFIDGGGKIEDVLESDDIDYWQEWLRFLATACEGGGFEVR